MALRPNPLTGQLEEDGLPEDPNAVPVAPAIPTQFNQVGAGGGGASGVPPIAVQVGSPDRPIQEVEQRQPGPGVAPAQAGLVAAQTQVDKASLAEGAVEQDEARLNKQYADERRAELQRQADDAAAAEAARQKVVADHLAADQQEIEREKQARIDAGKARATFWEGRPGAEIFTRLLQVVGGTAHDASGRGGPSPVDQAIEQNIVAHEKRLVSRWEATQQANVLRRQNRAAYEAELERRRIAAANQSLLSLGLIDEQLNAAIAGLGPEKQAAARQAKDASIAEQRARLELQRQDSYNKTVKDMTFAPGAGAGKAAEGQGKAAGQLLGIVRQYKEFSSVPISNDDLKNHRDNLQGLEAARKTASGGLTGDVAVSVSRKIGWTPQQEFQGVSTEGQKAILARQAALEDMNTMITGAAQSDPEWERRARRELPQPYDPPEVFDQKTRRILEFVEDRIVQTGPLAPIVQRRVDEVKGKSGAKAPGKPAAGGFNPDDENTWSPDQLKRALKSPKATEEEKRRIIRAMKGKGVK